MKRKVLWSLVSVLMILSLVVAACGPTACRIFRSASTSARVVLSAARAGTMHQMATSRNKTGTRRMDDSSRSDRLPVPNGQNPKGSFKTRPAWPTLPASAVERHDFATASSHRQAGSLPSRAFETASTVRRDLRRLICRWYCPNQRTATFASHR